MASSSAPDEDQHDSDSDHPRRGVGARGNWWGDHDESSDERADSESESEESGLERGVSRAEWIANTLLREGGEFVCPVALTEDPTAHPGSLHDQAGEEVGLTEPVLHEPQTVERGGVVQEAGVEPTRRRYNPQHGYVSHGGILKDRPTGEFLDLVEVLLGAVEVRLRPGERQTVMEYAHREKTGGDRSDLSIMTSIVEQLDAPGGIDFETGER